MLQYRILLRDEEGSWHIWPRRSNYYAVELGPDGVLREATEVDGPTELSELFRSYLWDPTLEDAQLREYAALYVQALNYDG